MRIWKIKPGSEDLDNEAMAMGGDADFEEAKWTAILVADFDHHRYVKKILSFFFFIIFIFSILNYG